MRECPKCSLQYDENHKICRACGAALRDSEPPLPLAEPPPETAVGRASPSTAQAPAAAQVRRGVWKCPRCGESVPGDFEVCWNCGTNEDGEPDPGFAKLPADEDDWPALLQAIENAPAAEQRELCCPKCGSAKIIPGAKVRDQGEYSNGKLQIVIFGDPEALIFKDRLYGTLIADICGDCGHVELKVENPSELYDHYTWSKEH